MPDLTHPPAEDFDLASVLAALGNPIRLDIVRRLAAGEALTCSSAIPDMPRSTASHHWRVMRESGVLHQQKIGKYIHMSLRHDDLNARFPGLLDSLLHALGQQPARG